MRPTTSAVLFALAVTLAGAPARAASEPRVVTGFAHPESVLIDGDRRFVSNIGEKLDPLGHDGDGFVSELDADGRIVALRALPIDSDRLDSPKGMAMLGGRLYVADIDRIVGFDLSRAATSSRSPRAVARVRSRKGRTALSTASRSCPTARWRSPTGGRSIRRRPAPSLGSPRRIRRRDARHRSMGRRTSPSTPRRPRSGFRRRWTAKS